MASMLACAKINLALHITGVREDGYHLLSSLVAFADFGDVVEVLPAQALSLTVRGAFASALQEGKDENLVLRAARLLQRHTSSGKGAALTLHKHLPVASGIGGGSADAAAAAKLLNYYWNIGMNMEELAALLLPLGADIPMCIYQKTAHIGGIGEIISPMSALPALGLVLVNPSQAVSTPEVFRVFDRYATWDTPIEFSTQAWDSGHRYMAFLKKYANSLQPAAIALAPVIGEVLAALEAAPESLLARMSGSGATCFALCASVDEAQALSKTLAERYPAWWVAAGGFLSSPNHTQSGS